MLIVDCKRCQLSTQRLVLQIRNRLVKRSKYLLPTNGKGELLDDKEFFNLTRESGIKYKGSGGKRPKTLTFPNFKISNKFPNNFCLLNDSSVFVCTDIVNHVISCSRYWLVGHRFSTIEDAFTEPFQSSKFNTYVASKLSDITYECDEKMISAKMYAFTMNLNCGLNIRSAKQKWFISALHQRCALGWDRTPVGPSELGGF